MPLPLIFYGDGPRLPSGLGRIVRDLILRLLPLEEELDIRVHQLGVDPPDGWHWQAWPFWGFQPSQEDQGRAPLTAILQELQKRYQQTPIVWMVMDPARCYDLLAPDSQGKQLPMRSWGYFPIDSENVQGAIGGPAAEAVWLTDRVLAYGEYGARVLHQTLLARASQKLDGKERHTRKVQVTPPPVLYLPHGLDAVWQPTPLEYTGEEFLAWKTQLPLDATVIGCVATNQPRKDLSLLFQSAALLKREGLKIGVWLHTDRLTHAWDVGQLALDLGFAPQEVCVSGVGEDVISDEQLAARYSACDVTLGPGLGEGFGYPLVESLACGTPVIHGRFAGGVELIPLASWLVEPSAWRLESTYAVKRPVLEPREVAAALAIAAEGKKTRLGETQAYCRGSVEHLRWEHLWPRWLTWIRIGLDEARRAPQPPITAGLKRIK